MKRYYLHTINGKPGQFDGDQICYARRSYACSLVGSLRQIRSEQRKTLAYRLARFGDDRCEAYSHQIVSIP